jgi:uncharacterized membrane protein YqjE
MPASGSPYAGESPNLFASLRAFWGVLVAILYTRLDLVTAELEDEATRLVKVVVAGLIGLLCVHTAFFFAMLFLLALVWNTAACFWVIGGIVALYSLGAIACVLFARDLLLNRPKFLSQTLAELRRDVEGLRQAAAIKKSEVHP